MSPDFNQKRKNLAFISKHFKWHERGMLDTRSQAICNPQDINVKIDIYEDRVNGWFLDIGRSLINNSSLTNDHSSEFVVLQIAVSYIEGNQQLRDGSDSRDKSGKCFARAVERIFTVNNKDAEILYGQVRCGLFHQGMTRKKVLLSNDFTKAITHEDGGIYINSRLFFECVSNDLQRYIQDLKSTDNKELRTNFEKMFHFGQEELPEQLLFR